ncbi:hypothetical protein XENTR_v10005033 [Xenopus tropicalis]|nr:hypothetical protein XENTR_v10005033 [Xenopus tropicalis]
MNQKASLSRKRVEPPTNKGNNTISLAEKYPEPGRYLKLGEPIGEDPNGVIYIGWHLNRRMEVAIVIVKDQEVMCLHDYCN